MPWYSCRCRSSHATDSASRWFVGSSSSSRSGFEQQEPAQRDAPALAARQLRDVGIGRRQPQRVHRDLELAVEIPAVHRVDLVLELRLLGEQLVEVGVGLAHRVADLFEPVEQALRVRDTVGDVAEHVLGRVEPRLLGQVADGEAGRDAALALVPVVLARDDPQQRRLAGAVETEHADLGAGVHRDVDRRAALPCRAGGRGGDRAS